MSLSPTPEDAAAKLAIELRGGAGRGTATA
jgi:hypothetical protein